MRDRNLKCLDGVCGLCEEVIRLVCVVVLIGGHIVRDYV